MPALDGHSTGNALSCESSVSSCSSSDDRDAYESSSCSGSISSSSESDAGRMGEKNTRHKRIARIIARGDDAAV